MAHERDAQSFNAVINMHASPHWTILQREGCVNSVCVPLVVIQPRKLSNHVLLVYVSALPLLACGADLRGNAAGERRRSLQNSPARDPQRQAPSGVRQCRVSD